MLSGFYEFVEHESPYGKWQMPREMLIVKTKNLCYGNRWQLPAVPRKVNVILKQNNIFWKNT